MEMKNILGLGERLKALIEKAESEAGELISQAQKKSDETLALAKEDADTKRQRAQRRTGLEEFLAESEAEAAKEAEKVSKEYEKRVQGIKDTSEGKIKEAVDFVLKEVLPQ
jgi:vacuolar-type H+-ATPase subunit H